MGLNNRYGNDTDGGNIGGYSKDFFNHNILPLTYDQEVLRTEVQTWLVELHRMGATQIDFIVVGDRFPNANYNDLVMVYEDFHRNGILEEVRARR
jgi:hypothetical protein